MTLFRVGPTGVFTFARSGIGVAELEDYRARYHSLDPWIATGMRLQQGRAFGLDGLVPHRELLRSEFYSEFLRPNGDLAHCMGCHFVAGGSHFAVSFQRQRGRPFEHVDEATLQRLVPHLITAMGMRERMAEAGRRYDVIDRKAVPGEECYLVDRAGVVSWSDIGGAPVCRIVAGCLQVPGVDEDLLRSAVLEATRSVAPVCGAVVSDGLVVCVDPAPGSEEGRKLAIVTVRDRRVMAKGRAERAAAVFHLTPSEACLCESLLAGLSLQEHADRYGVAISTIRTHAKMVMAKTGAARQAEIVALLSGLRPFK